MDTAAAAAPPSAERHEAIVASCADERVRLVLERIGPVDDRIGPIVLALDDEHVAALHSSGFRADPAGVEHVAAAELHDAPDFTVALRIARVGRRAAATGTRAVFLGQHGDLPGCAATHWPRTEIGLNVALRGLPIDVFCLYPDDVPRHALAERTHGVVTTLHGSTPSSAYRSPDDVVVEFPPPPPPDLGPPAGELSFGAADLGDVRRFVQGAAHTAGFDPDQTHDLVLAINELATNAVEHGGGTGVLRLWRHDGFVAEVTDHGGGMRTAFPGLAAPPVDGARGRGLWLAAELCDVLQVWPESDHTMVRVTVRPVLSR